MKCSIFSYTNFVIILQYLTLSAFGQNVICLQACEGGSDGEPCSCTGNYTFECLDKTCISIGKRRDGNVDCPDESDENIDCCEGSFKCDTLNRVGKCLPDFLVNDGVKDCQDGTDEDDINSKFCDLLESRAGVEEKLEDISYRCKIQENGSQVGKCIKWEWVLDGSEYCPLGDDEDVKLQDECSLNRDNCHEFAICTNIAGGAFACECRQGYLGNGIDCVLDQ